MMLKYCLIHVIHRWPIRKRNDIALMIPARANNNGMKKVFIVTANDQGPATRRIGVMKVWAFLCAQFLANEKVNTSQSYDYTMNNARI